MSQVEASTESFRLFEKIRQEKREMDGEMDQDSQGPYGSASYRISSGISFDGLPVENKSFGSPVSNAGAQAVTCVFSFFENNFSFAYCGKSLEKEGPI